MKNANVMGVHQFLGDGDHKKAIIYGELLKKVGLAKNREETAFEGGRGGGLISRCIL